ncbi:MAG: tRNA (adenosine(37)-N6)-threonylcarbamoyltransferase complex dimerization subunit type 1 TsaB [Pseudomonadota bacterium]
MPSSPTILAFDTSAAHVAAALLLEGRIIARVEDMARGQAERLIPLLEDVLAEGGIAWPNLDALGVGVGPGNFTGIRISVAAARGLALGLGIPAVGVSLFDTTQQLSAWAQTAVPGPRELFYFSDPDKQITIRMGPWTGGAFARSDEHNAEAHVATMARLAAVQYKRVQDPPKPLYVKPADAAPPRDAPPVLID